LFTVNIVGVFLPTGKDFSSAAGVVSALKKDVSAKLVATRSSDGPGEARDIFHHKQGTESGTDERKDSWWCVDLGESYRLFITHCALRHGKKDGEAILQRWRLQGSTDGSKWTDLKTSPDSSDHSPFRAPHPYFTGRWAVESEVGAFRYFRILQKGRNSSGKYGIYLSGVELYGTLVHLNSCHNTLNCGNLK